MIAGDLLPSDVLEMTLGEVAAIILVGGGITSHISFLVRSLNIPMVIVRSSELLDVADGTPILMDADVGNVYVNPQDEIIAKLDGNTKGSRGQYHSADHIRIQPRFLLVSVS